MVSFFKAIPIRHKIIVATVFMILFPMSVSGLYFYWSMSSELTKNAENNWSQIMGQTNDNIESSFKLITDTSLHMLSTKSVRTWLAGDTSVESDNYSQFVNKSDMEEELKYSLMFNTAWVSKLISTVYMFQNESNFSSISRSTKDVNIVTANNINIYNQQKGMNIEGIVPVPAFYNDNVIYYVRNVSNIYNPDQRLYLIIGIDESQIFNKYAALLEIPGAMVYLIDKQGFIYSSSNKNLIGNKVDSSILQLSDKTDINHITMDNRSYMVAAKKINESGLSFVICIPKKQILAKLSDNMKNYTLFLLLIMLVFLVSSIFLSLRFTRFIKDLLRNINQVKVGNYDAKMPEYSDLELNLLSHTFNKMTSEIKYLFNQVYEKQLLLKETELKFLQSQMNPHFLFNTLITIGYKARFSKDETVYKMVMSLTELLQASMYTDSKTKITIREELEIVNFYLYLQKMRFEDKLDFRIDVKDEALLDLYVPKFCLEPIVENAVVHGIENKVDKGTITITITEVANSIYFEIEDDGLGFKDDQINLDSAVHNERRRKGHNNIGLHNTNHRIKLIYGEQYGIAIQSQLNIGTKVSVFIPADKGENVHV
ncbi:sensor histidine kinase [Paenibacillus sp. CGMCC 1.16610]|uniref:HAMP domain-containing protein n=2 Tax=Paenibacillus TaxID=44249 RepID=A0ABW9UIH5_9BACL|nr:sensor histidine kinase [Paenibacillus sp. CGMCC 1.16610]MVQ39311.1 HAMP domain-containing protein [Paenibacillus anseongense]